MIRSYTVPFTVPFVESPVRSPYGSAFKLFADTFGSCPGCGDSHPLWSERKYHVDWDESKSIEHDPDAIRRALEVLAAAANGSPECNEPSLRTLVTSTYEAMSQMCMRAARAVIT